MCFYARKLLLNGGVLWKWRIGKKFPCINWKIFSCFVCFSQRTPTFSTAETYVSGVENVGLAGGKHKQCRRFSPFMIRRFQISLLARRISRLPPGGPGSRSTVNPAAWNILLTTPLAQYVVRMPPGFICRYRWSKRD